MRYASCAVICLPVNSMPMACLRGICCGKRCAPPAPAMRPTRGSGRPKRACSAAMIRSLASAISKPPPKATPFTAAMIGLLHSKSVVIPPNSANLSITFSPLALAAAVALRSLPAENARWPAPRQNGNPALLILLEVIEDLSQLNIRVVMQGIHDLGPIDGDVGNMPFFFVDHILIAHEKVFPFFYSRQVIRASRAST